MDSLTPSFSPLYQQIKDLILQSLQTGEWKPGEAIPSEMDLAARYRVSQGTVRKAIDELSADNLLIRRQGKGTFVATHAEQQCVTNLTCCAGDGNADGLFAHGGKLRSVENKDTVQRQHPCRQGRPAYRTHAPSLIVKAESASKQPSSVPAKTLKRQFVLCLI